MNMKRILNFALIFALVLACIPMQPFTANSPAYPAANSSGMLCGRELPDCEDSEPHFVEGHVLVRLADTPQTRGITPFSSASALPDLGVNISDMRLLNPSCESAVSPLASRSTRRTQNNVFLLELEDISVEDALEILNANPAVEIAEPNLIYQRISTPNDPLFFEQYALQKMDAERAWGITTGSREVVVGIIDTGIDGGHPDLVDNLWQNPNPNQNGYVNDIHGFSFGSRTGGIPYDHGFTHAGHGTEVAGIIGASGDNGIGVAGINWEVSLAWLGMGAENFPNSLIIEALNYANNHGMHITNNSWGAWGEHFFSQLLKDAIADFDGLFIAGAGNNGTDNDDVPFFPANFDLPNIISVASTNERDDLSPFSNFGKNSVDIAAPGSAVLTTTVFTNERGEPIRDYVPVDGTSFATPQVSGVAALIMAAHPDWSIEQVRAAILNSAEPLPNLTGRVATGGRLNMYHALVPRLPVESVTITPETLTLDINERGGFAAEISPAVGSYRALIWQSSDPNIAEVSPGGYVLALATGTATITARSYVDPTRAATAIVTVTDVVSDVIAFRDLNFKQGVIDALIEIDPILYANLTLASRIYPADVQKITELDLSGDFDLDAQPITNLEGIQHFTYLETLDVSNNVLTELDLSGNFRLASLDVSGNQLITLDVSGNPALTTLIVGTNQLTQLDLTNNPMLTTLSIDASRFTQLDLSGNPALTTLRVDAFTSRHTRLGLELDLRSNTALTDLTLSDVAGAWFNNDGGTVRVRANGPGTVSVQTSIGTLGCELFAPLHDGFRVGRWYEWTTCAFLGWMNPGGGLFTESRGGFDLERGQDYDLIAEFVRQNPFADVNSFNRPWYYNAVRYVYTHSLMAGTADDRFSPGAFLSRGMTAQLLYNMEGRPAVTFDETVFSDIAAGAWYANAVIWAYQNGIVQGVGGGRFDPGANITREQLATILYNYSVFTGLDTTIPSSASLDEFSDSAEVNDWAYDALRWLVQNDIMGGYSGRLRPRGTATRAECAALLRNFIERFEIGW